MLSTPRYLLLTILLLCATIVQGRNLHTEIAEKWQDYARQKELHVANEVLYKIAHDYYLLNDSKNADSVYDLCLEHAEQAGDDTLLIESYNQYFGNELYPYDQKSLDYAQDMLDIARESKSNEWLYHAYAAAANVYIWLTDYDNALQNADKAYYYANNAQDDELKGAGSLLLGQCLELKNKKIDAFKNYMSACYLAQKHDDYRLEYACYQRLAAFFRLTLNYPRAKYYKTKQLSLLKKAGITDSAEIMMLYNDLSLILYENKESYKAEKINNYIIANSIHNNYEQLKNIAFAIRRNHLVNNGLFGGLSELYRVQYPTELEKIAATNPGLYYRLCAYMAEADGQNDSAAYYYKLAERQTVYQSNDNVFIANFFKRYGQYLLRTGNIAFAKQKFDTAYKYAMQAHYFPYIIDATGYLDSINLLEKNYPAAYVYAKQNRLYTDSQAMAAREDELLLLEIDNETMQHDLELQKEEAKVKRRHNIEYLSIIILISTLFTILLMLGSFRVPKALVRITGFMSFILLFEFIIMLSETSVEHYIHGSPLKLLLFKIVVIASLAPIHHGLEHRLINYLYEHRLIDTSKISLRPLIAWMFKRKVKPVVVAKPEVAEEVKSTE